MDELEPLKHRSRRREIEPDKRQKTKLKSVHARSKGLREKDRVKADVKALNRQSQDKRKALRASP